MIREIKAIIALFRGRIEGRIVPLMIFLGVLSSLAEGVGITLFIPLLQNMRESTPHEASGSRIVDFLATVFDAIPRDHRIVIICAAIFGTILIRAALLYGNEILYGWVNARINHRLRSDIFRQLTEVSVRFLERSQSGDLLNTLGTESWRACEAINMLIYLAISLCTLAIYTTLLFLISWKMTIVVAVAMLLISLFTRGIARRAKVIGEKVTRANAALSDRMMEGFYGIKLIHSFGHEAHEQKLFERASQNVSQLFFKQGVTHGAIGPIYEICAGSLLIAIMFGAMRDPTQLSALLVFIFVLYRLQPRIQAVDGARTGLASLSTAVSDVRALLDPTDKPFIVSGEHVYTKLKTGIRFDRVSFHYDSPEDAAIEDVSLVIPAGKTTALVGPSGAGKSTLIALIFRFYDPASGTILLDDQPLPSFQLDTWRNRIAIVSQDVHMFNNTIRDNIAYGRLDATNDEIIAAAKLADAHDFISQLPQGYDTRAGDRGVRLSGGQKQRITLARAIVRNPEILILDEATNALDSISEHLIQEALDMLSKDRTVIVIAHRLSTVEQADHIVVLEEGRVAEEGDMDRLLKNEGLFARLYKLQNRGALVG